MEGVSYSIRQIVWAKPDKYPWWPATITKLPDPNKNNNHFKVVFVGEDNYAILEQDKVSKYAENYGQFSKLKLKKLQKAIENADEMLARNKKSIKSGSKSLATSKKMQNAATQQSAKKNKNTEMIDGEGFVENMGRKQVSHCESLIKVKSDPQADKEEVKICHQSRSSRVRTIRKYTSFEEEYQKSEVSLMSQQGDFRQAAIKSRKKTIKPTRQSLKSRKAASRRPNRSQQNSPQDNCEEEGIQQCSNFERVHADDSDDRIISNEYPSQQNDSELDSLHFSQQVINRANIEKFTSELNEIIMQFQANKFACQDETQNQWKYQQYFLSFRNNFLTCQELLQSNLTKMLRYIIVRMTELKFHPSKIMQVESISQQLKARIMKHLTNTDYYDMHLKRYDRDQRNKKSLREKIKKIIKTYHRRQIQTNTFSQPHSNSFSSLHSLQSLENSQIPQSNSLNFRAMGHHPPKIKNLHIDQFAEIVCDRIGNGCNFEHIKFLNDIKQNKYRLHEILTTKAATQRFAQFVLQRYSHQ